MMALTLDPLNVNLFSRLQMLLVFLPVGHQHFFLPEATITEKTQAPSFYRSHKPEVVKLSTLLRSQKCRVLLSGQFDLPT